MPHLLVIGGASLDILHFAGQQTPSAGGAGMYTAMAAQRCNVQVSLFAPRPSSIPETLQPVIERVTAWHGPTVPPEELPHFEIAHRESETVYLKAAFGAEEKLSPDLLPLDLSLYDCIHIVPLGDAERQLAFLDACRRRGAKRISVGTYFDAITNKKDIVQFLIERADIFFMNKKEAMLLVSNVDLARTAPGKLLFVTLGEKGAVIIQGGYRSEVPATSSKELDPTGAGDTFCGATLAHLLQGVHPVMAARLAMPLAAKMTEYIGPAALFETGPPPGLPLDARVVVNNPQVVRLSQLIATHPEVAPFDFTGSAFPLAGHPAALDYFFASILQQFSFWSADGGRYHKPLIAPINGSLHKGSFYLFESFMRPLEDDPEFYTPARQAELTRAEMLALFRADDGSDPMPALDLHLDLAQQYGRDMLALGLTPHKVILQAQTSEAPLRTFFELLDHIGGYKEDPLRKKSGLLALVLNQRPEVFLSFGASEQVPPVIDYHLMRSCLRTGLIDVLDETLREELIARQLLSPVDEWAVRHAAYRAIEQVVTASGRDTGAVDWFFFNARKRCPEMTEPVCHTCPIDPVCARRKHFFQPVMRTTFY